MKNNEENFEARLSGQSLRPVPPEWRGEILAAARAAQAEVPATVVEESWLAAIQRRLVALLWPHPKAWAGLAAVWVCIGMMNFSTREAAPKLATKPVPPSPEIMAELKQQRRMFAELVGGREAVDTDRPKAVPTRPRSGRVAVVVI